MKKRKNVLVFVAHSDDHVIGAGGTLAKYAHSGYNVYVYVFSHGEAGIPWLKKGVAVETRFKELIDANKLLGLKRTYAFGLSDGKCKYEIEKYRIVEKISRLIKEKKPCKIFVHSANDSHPDHRAVHDAVVKGLRKSRIKSDLYSFDIWSLFRFRHRDIPKLYVDVSDTFRLKLKALRMFRSQWIVYLIFITKVFLSAFLNGLHSGTRFAEMFYKEK